MGFFGVGVGQGLQQMRRDELAKQQLKLQQQSLKLREDTAKLERELLLEKAQLQQQKLARRIGGREALGRFMQLLGPGPQAQVPQLPLTPQQPQAGATFGGMGEILQPAQPSQARQFTPFSPQQARQEARLREMGQAVESGVVKFDTALEAMQSTQAGGLGVQGQLQVQAILSDPRLFNDIRAETREALIPALAAAGFRREDAQDPTKRARERLQTQKALADLQETIRKNQGQAFTPREAAENALKLRAAIRSEPSAKNFEQVQGGLASIEVGARRNDAQGDLALINGFARILDPGSVVRPSEFVSVEQSQGFFERMGMVAEKISSGQRLLPEVRQRFLATARQIAQERSQLMMSTLEQVYRPRAEALGVAFESLFVRPPNVSQAQREPAPAGQAEDLSQVPTDELFRRLQKQQGGG